MRPSTRQSVIRKLLSALLHSSLSARELREVADELISNSKFATDLSVLLGEIVAKLEDMAPQKSTANSASEFDQIESVLASFKRRKISKSELLKVISALEPNSARQYSSSKLNSIEIAKEFLSSATPEQRLRFSVMLSPRNEASLIDPYLLGILKKK